MGGNCFSSENPVNMNPPVVIPALVRHTATVIFMHGLGDTGHGWAQAMQMIRAPYIKYVCPTAPVMPVTLNAGFQMPSWFDIIGLSPDSGEDEAGIRAAAKNVQSLIEEEIKTGIASNRILLGGFSQGGGLALFSGLTYDKPLAGIAALSAWLPIHREFPANCTVNKEVYILQCHGGSDPLVIPPVGQITAQTLKQFDPNHTFKMYPSMAHSSCEEEMQDLKKFIEQRLPPI